jgi:hypothetical protein
MTIHLRDISFWGEGVPMPVAYITDAGLTGPEGFPRVDNVGMLTILLNSDGYQDVVAATDLGRTGDLPAIDRAISALQHLRGYLVDTFGDRLPVGQCMEFGEYGRCVGDHGHEGEHVGPGREAWLATMVATKRFTPAQAQACRDDEEVLLS